MALIFLQHLLIQSLKSYVFTLVSTSCRGEDAILKGSFYQVLNDKLYVQCSLEPRFGPNRGSEPV